jgi:hypothetical protein
MNEFGCARPGAGLTAARTPLPSSDRQRWNTFLLIPSPRQNSEAVRPLAAWRENNSRHVASLRRIRLAFFIAPVSSTITGRDYPAEHRPSKIRRGITGYRQAAEAMTAMRGIMGRLKLTMNEDKTRICRLPDGSFDFLGYNFGRCYSTKTGRPYLGTRPSKKSIKHILEAVHMHTARSMDLLDATEVVQRLNWALGGWANYFQLGPVTKAYRFIDAYTTRRLRRWLCRKHRHSGAGWTRYPDEYLYQTLGLIRLPISLQRLPWAKA